MVLQERGHVDVQAPARRYAGSWFSHQAQDRTHPDYSLTQLLNHTSGLATYARIYWHNQDRPVQGLDDSFRKYGFAAQPPGVVSEYSNLGYGLVGYIIAEQSGTSLANFLNTEIFGPLGMHDAMMVDSFAAPTKTAKKYDANGALLVDTYNDTPGAGNVYASAHDLALFGAFHLTVVINATDANPRAQAFANALIQAVEPAYLATEFNATQGFDRFTNQPEFLGRWEGSIAVDGTDVPWVLNFEADGSVRAEFPQRAAGSLLPTPVTFPALVNGNLLVATFATTLPASDVVQTPDGYVLLRLLRRGDELSGAAIAYASTHRLEHLYPFAAHLRRRAQ